MIRLWDITITPVNSRMGGAERPEGVQRKDSELALELVASDPEDAGRGDPWQWGDVLYIPFFHMTRKESPPPLGGRGGDVRAIGELISRETVFFAKRCLFNIIQRGVLALTRFCVCEKGLCS